MHLPHIATLCLFALSAPVLAEERVAEDQTPTGKFLTAGEVRPILNATKTSWIGVREFDGQDLVYFTHLLAWRCGLYEVQYTINGGAAEVFPIPECPADIENAMTIPEDTQIFITQPLGSVNTVDVTVLYDDLGTDTVQFERASVMLP